MKQEEKNIPENTKGKKTDVSESVECSTEQEAKEHFKVVRNRLLDVSHWHEIAGGPSAKFQLTDSKGNPVHRLAKIGDYFRIDIPAPGTVTGEGNDWVQIEEIDDHGDLQAKKEYTSIRVRPTSNPRNADKETAHFFKDEATSTFLVKRENLTVYAEVHGRNEVPNTTKAGIVDTLRNAVVAVGAILGFSEVQWKSLVKGLVSKKLD